MSSLVLLNGERPLVLARSMERTVMAEPRVNRISGRNRVGVSGAGFALGGIAGIVGTAAMTAVMTRLHHRLPPPEQYPLPPREITQRVLPVRSERALQEASLLAHFGYGAAAGAIYGSLVRRGKAPPGAVYGVAVWVLSYLGWVPAARILRPAVSHPSRRNALMIASHLVWGAVTALVYKDLSRAHRSAFAGADVRDAAKPAPASAARLQAQRGQRRRSRTASHGMGNPSIARDC